MEPRPPSRTQLATAGAAAAVIAGAVAALTLPADEARTPGAADGSRVPATTGSTGAATPVGALVQAEALTLDPAKGQAFDDPDANGGRGLLLWADGAVTTKLAGPVDHPRIRVRGDQCAGAPSMRVRLNGEKVAAVEVRESAWTTITVGAASRARDNVLSIAYFGDAGQPGCDRNLRLDWIAASRAAEPDGEPSTASTPVERADEGPSPTPQPTATVPATAARDDAPAGDTGLYVDPDSTAARAARRLASAGSPDEPLVRRIAREPAALWLGEWSGDVAAAARSALDGAARSRTRVVFAVYAIPGRDCGSYSAGGLPAERYRGFIDDLARAIGDRPASIVLEPDALAQADCLDAAAQAERYALLRAATTRLAQGRGTRVYLDAGHADWKPAAEMASRLRRAGIAEARGFALNTSNFGRTDDEVAYGRQIAAAVGGKPFVVDTSRNGNGPDGDQWCNPAGRALGHAPTLRTGLPGVDAFLWVKRPGESDGTCNGGPPAGQWWPAGAVALARAAG